MRKAIGERTLTSVNEIPQFHLRTLVDMEPLMALREHLKQSEAVGPTYNDLLIKAVAVVLREYPLFNAWCDPEQLRLLESVNIGFAVSTEQGVLLPTIRDADVKNLAEIAEETREMIELARAGRLRASLQMGAGFTISNLGPAGIDSFAPIISPPQVAILGVGSIKPQALVIDEQVMARRAAHLTLVMDHRASGGAEGAAFLSSLEEMLIEPETIAED